MTATSTSRPRPLIAELTLTRRAIIHTVATPDALVMSIVLPIVLMLMFTFVFGGAIDRGGDYVNYVVPGIILLCAGFGSSSTAVSVSNDMTNGVIDRFRTMRFRASAVITGHVVASVLRNALATAIVIGVALAVGFRPAGGPLEWLAATAIVLLYILGITYVFAAIGVVSSSADAAMSYGFVLLFLPYVSSAFVPVETMPEWLRGFAEHQPLTPIIETIRGLITGRSVGPELWAALAWCAGILVVGIVLSVVLFARRSGRR
jgi:ABC-2 type transport system permease protein